MELLLGAAVGLVVQLIKRVGGTEGIATYLVLIGSSLLAGGIYYLAVHSVHWKSILEILTAAAAFHNLVIRKIPVSYGGEAK